MNSSVARASERSKARAHAPRGRFGGRSRGQAFVELAIVLPVLMVLLLAALDLGRIFFANITIANAAREGVYEASYGGSYSAGQPCGGSNSVMCAIVNEAQGSLTIAPADVAYSCNPVGGCASGAYGDEVTITVTGHFDLITPVLSVFFGGTNLTFSSTASADVVDVPDFATGATAAPTATATPLPTDTPIPTVSPIPTVAPTPTAPVCSPPVPDFTWTQQNKTKPVVFTSSSTPTSGTCAITFYRWEYGPPDDGIDAGDNLTSISHQFAIRGQTYLVTLTVTNPFGSVSISKNVTTQS